MITRLIENLIGLADFGIFAMLRHPKFLQFYIQPGNVYI